MLPDAPGRRGGIGAAVAGEARPRLAEHDQVAHSGSHLLEHLGALARRLIELGGSSGIGTLCFGTNRR